MALPIDLQRDEKIIKVVRRHPIFFVTRLFLVGLGGLVPVIFLLILAFSTKDAIRVISLVAAALWALGWLVVTFFTWYRYQNDLWIISNQRLVDSLKINPFNHRLSSTDLINVEDMSVTKKGILPTVFNFGDLRCQTAGTEENFILSGIPNPSNILALVDRARDDARRELASRGSVNNIPGSGLR